MKTKNLILAAFFLVSWNEYDLQTTRPCPPPELLMCCKKSDIYMVEMSTYTVKLATQKDVDLFIQGYTPIPESHRDYSKDHGHNYHYVGGVIDPKAFNIKVEEVR